MNLNMRLYKKLPSGVWYVEFERVMKNGSFYAKGAGPHATREIQGAISELLEGN